MPRNSASNEDAFLGRLELPMAWETLERSPSDRLRDLAEQSNAGILAFLLHGIELDARPLPTDEQLAEALLPLRTKLDMLIEMVARLSYRDIELPPRCAIELREQRITWLATRLQKTREWLQFKLYFHPVFREPVVVFGQVASAAAAALPGERYRIEAELAEISEPTLGNLDRLVLLTQRRQRAQQVAATAARAEW